MATRVTAVILSTIVSLFVITSLTLGVIFVVRTLNEQPTSTALRTPKPPARARPPVITSGTPEDITTRRTTSDKSETTGATTVAKKAKTVVPNLNNKLSVISKNDPRYEAFRTAANRFYKLVNKTVNPCDDFYGFVCGKMGKDMSQSFDEALIWGSKLMVNKFQDEKYREATKSAALKKLFIEYDMCMKYKFRPNKEYFLNKYNELREEVGFDFPFRRNSKEKEMSKKQLAKAIGFISVHSTDTLLSRRVSINNLAPQSKHGYLLFLDESNLIVERSTYANPYMWKQQMVHVIKNIATILRRIARGLDIREDEEKIMATAEDIVEVEYTIANIPSPLDKLGGITYNVFSKAMAEEKFPSFDWDAYFGELSKPLPNLRKEMLQDNFKFIITKPDVIGELLEIIQDGTLSTRSLANYLYFRYLNSFIKYVPIPEKNSGYTPYDMLKEAAVQYEKKARRTRTIVKPTIPSADHFNHQTSCASLTAYRLPYANARMFIDALFKTKEERTLLRKDVSKYVSSIMHGFRSQIDGLTWMSYESKKGAYGKIDNLVRNIGYPDFVVNDTLLDAYYDALKYDGDQSFAEHEEAFRRFEFVNDIRRLLIKTGTERDDFPGPPSISNAYYLPELNSITFPIGVLVEPFYNKDWPAAVNYGSIGVIAGHELTHGYDNSGIHWDGVGKYRDWMDESSAASFYEMAKCVVDQYSKFCPLEKSKTQGCINGWLTQKENVADNGGIRAAYRAFKNHVSFNGPDPRLDHEDFKHLSGDQLFFMSFAQVWCQQKPADRDLYYQLMTDEHSPAPYRVLGTIQNFPEFRQAFHCPTGHQYTPEKHCNIWVTDVSSSHGIPTPPANPVNEGTKEEVDPTDTDKYKAYMNAANLLEESIDLKKDPCNSFYEYACGNFKKSLSFVESRQRNYLEQANQLSDPKYKKHGPEALKKTINFYEKCIEVLPRYRKEIDSGDIVRRAIEDFAKKTTFTFNMVENQAGGKKVPKLNGKTLATALGVLSSKGINTLLSLMIDTDWAKPENGYLMYVDQNTLFYPKSYYKRAAWKTIKADHLENTIKWFQDYAAVMKKNLDEKILREDIEKLFDLELNLAEAFSTSEVERRQFKRSYNVRTIAEAQKDMMFIDLKQYLKAYAGSDVKLKQLFRKQSYKIAIMEPHMIKKLSKAISKYTDDQKIVLVDYLFYRILMEKLDFLPRKNNHKILETQFDIPHLGRPRRKERYPLPDLTGSDKDEKKRFSIYENEKHKRYCAYKTLEYLPLANARLFVDYLYPKEKDREHIRAKAKGIMDNVAKSFQLMVSQLDWMDDESKKGAYEKITDLHVNLVYPDLIMDDKALNDYFKDLSFTNKDTYFTMLDKIEAFNFNKTNSQLLKDKYDRNDFFGPPGTVNAWYMPEMNSISLPAGILRQPFFDENWPASMNYGGIGVLAGHELTRGFDDQGVQWDGEGKLRDWMTEKSKEGFRNMAKCVGEEYGRFCPLKNTSYQPQCVDGWQTQGENIADNGGIRAAFKGYQNHVSLNGPDPQLPGRLMSRFSHDQLFFLSFAQAWCQEPYPPERLYKQLMVDPHTPSKYRVFGAIQNFPEFRAAFNCPVGSEYGPEPGKFCPVWVPQV